MCKKSACSSCLVLLFSDDCHRSFGLWFEKKSKGPKRGVRTNNRAGNRDAANIIRQARVVSPSPVCGSTTVLDGNVVVLQ